MPQLPAAWLTPALFVLVGAAAVLVLFNEWRLSFIALAVEYAAAAVLIRQFVIGDVALAKLLVGGLVTAILALTGWRLHFGQAPRPDAPPVAAPRLPQFRFTVPTNFPFRVMATLLVVIGAGAVATQPGLTLPGLDGLAGLNLASYLLMALGLLNLGLTEEPINAGMGLLTLINGFELFYAAVEPSLAIVALLAAIEFSVALAASYLAAVQFAGDPATEESAAA